MNKSVSNDSDISSSSENLSDDEIEFLNKVKRFSFKNFNRRASKANRRSSLNSIRETNSKSVENLNESFDNLSISPDNSNIDFERMAENRETPKLDLNDLNVIPTFDGNPNKLHRFIAVAESILFHYYDREDTGSFQNIKLINGIINKLQGKAEEAILIRGADTWENIKNTLIQTFGDRRDENTLTQDLVNLKQKSNETPFQFYENCRHTLSIICNYIELHSETNEEKISKRAFFTTQTLRTFLAGLREPLGPIIRAMRPGSLEDALRFIEEEDNIRYSQRSSHSNNSSISKPPQNNISFQRPTSRNNISPNFYPNFQNNASRPFFSNNSNQFRQQFPIRQPFPQQRSAQNSSNPFGFSNPNTNVWKPKNISPQNKPAPMSISNRFTFQSPIRNNSSQQNMQNAQRPYKNNFFSNNGQPKNFYSEELYNCHSDKNSYCEKPSTSTTSCQQNTDGSDEYYDESFEQSQEMYYDDNSQNNVNFHSQPQPDQDT